MRGIHRNEAGLVSLALPDVGGALDYYRRRKGELEQKQNAAYRRRELGRLIEYVRDYEKLSDDVIDELESRYADLRGTTDSLRSSLENMEEYADVQAVMVEQRLQETIDPSGSFRNARVYHLVRLYHELRHAYYEAMPGVENTHRSSLLAMRRGQNYEVPVNGELTSEPAPVDGLPDENVIDVVAAARHQNKVLILYAEMLYRGCHVDADLHRLSSSMFRAIAHRGASPGNEWNQLSDVYADRGRGFFGAANLEQWCKENAKHVPDSIFLKWSAAIDPDKLDDYDPGVDLLGGVPKKLVQEYAPSLDLTYHVNVLKDNTMKIVDNRCLVYYPETMEVMQFQELWSYLDDLRAKDDDAYAMAP